MYGGFHFLFWSVALTLISLYTCENVQMYMMPCHHWGFFFPLKKQGRWLHLFQLVEKQYQEQILAQQEQYQCQIQVSCRNWNQCLFPYYVFVCKWRFA